MDSFSMTCRDCNDGAGGVAPLLILVAIAVVVGVVVAFNYTYLKNYFEGRMEQLFMHMNQGTMMVSLF